MKDEKSSLRIAEFFKAEYTRMVGFVGGLIDDAADRDVEDVVQDVMLNIFDTADVTRPVENLSAYIYRSLRNRVIDLLRKRKPEVSLDAIISGGDGLSLAGILHDIRYNTASDFEKNELRREIFNAVDSLDVEEQMIIVMTEFEGRTFREISEETDIPLGTLLSRKSRAIKKIKKELVDLIL
jgi:RNA polymerase sigma factor (sigma-70 family)